MGFWLNLSDLGGQSCYISEMGQDKAKVTITFRQLCICFQFVQKSVILNGQEAYAVISNQK